MKSKKWIRLAAVVAVVAMLSTGCSLFDGKETATAIRLRSKPEARR